MTKNKGRFIETQSRDVYFNLALEQAIIELHEYNDYKVTIRLWQNEKSVILGRGQSLTNEVNEKYCQKENIKIARRISGGGSVFQDEGNWNISIFVDTKILEIKYKLDLKELELFFTQLLVESLNNMQIDDLSIEDLTNILHEGRKISGAAAYRKRDTIVHHATLLVNANLRDMDNSLLIRTNNPRNRRESRYRLTKNLPNLDIKKWIIELNNIVSKKFSVEIIKNGISKDEKNLSLELMEKMYKQNFWIRNGKRRLISK